MICDNLTVSNGRLLFAGQDTVELARQYGTPLYLMDEDRIRANCRVYTEAFRRHFGPGARPLYASKANSFQRIYEIMREEGMGIDVVSSGEIYTALRAGYDLGQAYFHSNNKTDEDIRYSMDHGIGYFVADNVEEIKAIEAEAARRGIKQRVLLRLTPGIDPHTYEAIATGKVDSKFGSAIETGQAEEITLFTLRQPTWRKPMATRPGSLTWAAATACATSSATPFWTWTPRWPRWPPRPRAPAPAWASPCPRFTWSPDAASWETRD